MNQIYQKIKGNLEKVNDNIPKTGNRGILAGNETPSSLSGNQVIDINSPDSITLSTSGNVSLSFTAGAPDICAVKVITCTASSDTVMSFTGASWANNKSSPVWGKEGEILVLVAYFVGGRVILSIFDNTQIQ